MIAFENSVYVGGSFRFAGGKPSWAIAQWTDVTTPVLLSDFQAQAQSQSVRLQWSLDADQLHDFRALHIQRALKTTQSFTTLAVLRDLQANMAFDDSSVNTEENYLYRLLFEKDSGELVPSRSLEVFVPTLTTRSALVSVQPAVTSHGVSPDFSYTIPHHLFCSPSFGSC